MTFLEDLNPQQREAVTAPLGPVLVLAGPGSGKTRVLSYRIAYLTTSLEALPSQIMAVTFTNKAAREMRIRAENLLARVDLTGRHSGRVTLGTFHSIAARILRRESNHLPVTRDFTIFDQSDQLSLIRQVLKAQSIDPKKYSPTKVLNAISAAKNEMISPDIYPAGTYFDELVRRVYQDYQQRLLANNALDFDDLLVKLVNLLKENADLLSDYQRRYPHILVDEFQDTNTVQYTLLRLLSGDKPDLFAVGDPDQSIYLWRGADYRNVHRFQEDYSKSRIFLLEQNYRSTQIILDAAMAVIDRQVNRQHKQLFTERQGGSPIIFHEAYNEDDEAQYVVDTIAELVLQGLAEPGDCAIMYRINAQSRTLEESFLKANLPYRLVGAQRFYGRREVKDLVAYLRLIQNLDDQISLLRVLNTPSRGLGEKTVAILLETAEKAHLSPGQVLLDLAQGAASEFYGIFHRRQATALSGFGRILAGWFESRGTLSLPELIDRIIEDTGYRAYIDDGTEEGEDRWANLLELRSVAYEFLDLGLTTFLEHVALISDQDTLTNAQNAPTLLTLHAAKGLEFPVVFIIGLDDGVLPHQRSFDNPESMAEERRLFYVGITRTKDRLIITRTFRRRIYGSSSLTDPSRYLDDLPPELVQGDLPGLPGHEPQSFQRQTRWAPRTYDRPPEMRYKPGMRVRHARFGEGIVLESRIDRIGEEVTIEFEQVGLKRLVASLAGLEVLND